MKKEPNEVLEQGVERLESWYEVFGKYMKDDAVNVALVTTYCEPEEAEGITWKKLVKLAKERDAEAAEQLKSSFEAAELPEQPKLDTPEYDNDSVSW